MVTILNYQGIRCANVSDSDIDAAGGRLDAASLS